MEVAYSRYVNPLGVDILVGSDSFKTFPVNKRDDRFSSMAHLRQEYQKFTKPIKHISAGNGVSNVTGIPTDYFKIGKLVNLTEGMPTARVPVNGNIMRVVTLGKDYDNLDPLPPGNAGPPAPPDTAPTDGPGPAPPASGLPPPGVPPFIHLRRLPDIQYPGMNVYGSQMSSEPSPSPFSGSVQTTSLVQVELETARSRLTDFQPIQEFETALNDIVNTAGIPFEELQNVAATNPDIPSIQELRQDFRETVEQIATAQNPEQVYNQAIRRMQQVRNRLAGYLPSSSTATGVASAAGFGVGTMAASTIAVTATSLQVLAAFMKGISAAFHVASQGGQILMNTLSPPPRPASTTMDHQQRPVYNEPNAYAPDPTRIIDMRSSLPPMTVVVNQPAMPADTNNEPSPVLRRGGRNRGGGQYRMAPGMMDDKKRNLSQNKTTGSLRSKGSGSTTNPKGRRYPAGGVQKKKKK